MRFPRFVWAIGCGLLCGCLLSCQPKSVELIHYGQSIRMHCSDDDQVLQTSCELFRNDFQKVFHAPLQRGCPASSKIIVETIEHKTSLSPVPTELIGKREAFVWQLLDNGVLVITGSDAQGAAYGLLELSRRFGVSPWEWWADAEPSTRESFSLPKDHYEFQSPSVAYRGIFINDEDWGLLPWSHENHAPSEVAGRIGPATHKRIFELLLRLKANSFWPAMHECSEPFYFTPGNWQAAEQYGIHIATSHCEPMMCNTNGEWKHRGIGDYDYVHNSENVYRFWEERVRKVAHTRCLYTLGMRGVHDGAMQGAKTIDEQKAVLERVLHDQRRLIGQYVDANVEQVPQVFIPYKEVLDIYHAGLAVPEDVCLMWCDDNYGYIRHFPTEEERARKGGNGLYYHASYWGRPHDYLWLSTLHPALLFQQLTTAYERGIQRMWILNVGDIKPAEYLIELFLDMAWDMEGVRSRGWRKHQQAFFSGLFGDMLGGKIAAAMEEYYHLAFVRKPEFMGNTRTEERDPAYKQVKDLDWSEAFIRKRLADYTQLSDQVEVLSKQLPPAREESFFQLVGYPVQASTQMNVKFLQAQLARHGLSSWEKSQEAHDSIQSLTQRYNTPKWKGIMSSAPRRLPVFQAIRPDTLLTSLRQEPTPLFEWAGADADRGNFETLEELGHSRRSAALKVGEELIFDFTASQSLFDLELACLPVHPITSEGLRLAIRLDQGKEQIVDIQTHGRSEEWKQNVLRNQALRHLRLESTESDSTHQLFVRALSPDIVVDALRLFAADSH